MSHISEYATRLAEALKADAALVSDKLGAFAAGHRAMVDQLGKTAADEVDAIRVAAEAQMQALQAHAADIQQEISAGIDLLKSATDGVIGRLQTTAGVLAAKVEWQIEDAASAREQAIDRIKVRHHAVASQIMSVAADLDRGALDAVAGLHKDVPEAIERKAPLALAGVEGTAEQQEAADRAGQASLPEIEDRGGGAVATSKMVGGGGAWAMSGGGGGGGVAMSGVEVHLEDPAQIGRLRNALAGN